MKQVKINLSETDAILLLSVMGALVKNLPPPTGEIQRKNYNDIHRLTAAIKDQVFLQRENYDQTKN